MTEATTKRAAKQTTMPCIKCEKSLINLFDSNNQPLGGLEFVARGHYGCSVFDPMDGSVLALNICDECLLLVPKGTIGTYEHLETARAPATFKAWEPSK